MRFQWRNKYELSSKKHSNRSEFRSWLFPCLHPAFLQHGTDGTCGEPAFHPGQHVQPAGNTLPFPFRLAFPIPAAQRLREVKARVPAPGRAAPTRSKGTRVQNPSTFSVCYYPDPTVASHQLDSLTMWVARFKNWYIHILDIIPWNKFGFSAVISISFYRLPAYIYVYCVNKKMT